MKNELCPRCKQNDACAPHECTLTWSGKNGEICTVCKGKGGTYAPSPDDPEGPDVKTICTTCKGQGAVNTPEEPKCTCCYSCQALCHQGIGPNDKISPLAL